MTVVKTQTSLDIITSPGQVITYQIVVTNTGTTNLTNVVAEEDYPGDGDGSCECTCRKAINKRRFECQRILDIYC